MSEQHFSVINNDNKNIGECDCCHDVFGVFQLHLDVNGEYVYCDRCSADSGCSLAWQNASLGG